MYIRLNPDDRVPTPIPTAHLIQTDAISTRSTSSTKLPTWWCLEHQTPASPADVVSKQGVWSYTKVQDCHVDHVAVPVGILSWRENRQWWVYVFFYLQISLPYFREMYTFFCLHWWFKATTSVNQAYQLPEMECCFIALCCMRYNIHVHMAMKQHFIWGSWYAFFTRCGGLNLKPISK